LILPDVSALVYAHHEESADHDAYRSWWEDVVNSPSAFGVADLVLSGFIRVVSHPRIFDQPMRSGAALAATKAMRARSNAVQVRPGERHWTLFSDLVESTNAKGNAVPDAYLAALAIESGNEFVTCDRGFARYPGLRWRHPLDP